MDLADEEFLTGLHRNLELRDLFPDDPRYVDLEGFPEAVGPVDPVRALTTQIVRSTRSTAYFLSGLRGSGKTTQLRRLREELQQRGFAAVRLDAEDYLNLRQPLDVVEFLFFLVGGISDEVARAGWLPPETAVAKGWDRLRHFLTELPRRITPTEAQFSAGVDVPGLAKSEVNLKAQIRKDESFVAGLRAFLDGRLSELTEAANTIVDDLVVTLRDRWAAEGRGEWQGLVVLVDSLDHVRGADFHTIRRALRDLFDKQSSTIALDSCRTVFIVPPYLQIDYGVVRWVPNVKVHDRDRDPWTPGVNCLREVVRRRIPDGEVDRLFKDEAALDEVILASGGNLRDLLRLVTEIEVQADELPVPERTIELAVQQVRRSMLPLSDEELACLAGVSEEQRAPLLADDRWDELALLYDRHLVLGYANGEDWYDVHPLVLGEVNRYRERRRRSGPGGTN